MKVPDSRGGNNYTIPVSNGILTWEHRRRIGPALWLFLWYVDHTTAERDGVGLVLGGKPVPDHQPAAALGLGRRRVQQYRERLEREGYIQGSRTATGYVIRVMRSKKWPPRDGRKTTIRWQETGHRDGKVPAIEDQTVQLDSTRTAAAGPAAAASPNPNPADVWAFLGIAPCGPPAFRQLLESRWSCRNGRSPAAVLGETVDAWEAANGEKPRRAGAFFRSLAEIRRRDRETAQPTLDDIAPIPPEVLEQSR